MDCLTPFNTIVQTLDIRAEFGIPNLPQSPDIGKNSDGGISDFRISGQSLIKENCHNSRTSNDIDIKLGPVIKLYNINKIAHKDVDDDVMSAKIVTSLSFLQFMANLWPKPEAGFQTHSL